ncbi:MAG: kelch motif-containing protein [Akkermansiaceae bacterium]|nr:kelch motif-containing protein [Akkermansiaceae bacterium]
MTGSDGSGVPVPAVYDPLAGSWAVTGSPPLLTADATSTLLANGQVLVTGGGLTSGTQAAAALYSPDSGTFATTVTMTAARQKHSATLFPDGRVLIVGGLDENGVLPTAEFYLPDGGVAAVRWTSIAKLPGGDFVASFLATPGGKTVIATEDLTLPKGLWTVVGPATEGPPGQFSFTDPDAASHPKRFYQIIEP